MNRRKWILALVSLALIGSTALLLSRMKSSQRLGAPGVKTHAQTNGPNLVVELPEKVLDFTSEWIEEDKVVVATLPRDTSYGQRKYTAPDGFYVYVNAVLMRGDRSSIHRPQFCLTGQGWKINDSESREEVVRVEQPFPYDLPVMKIVSGKMVKLADGQSVMASGLFVYWFVAEDAYTARDRERMWWMARKLLTDGELQRWAYVSCFAPCLPGHEEETFGRIKKLIAASVPEFQLTPRGPSAAAATTRN